MELANIYSTDKTTNSEEYVKSTLKNSAFCMSERASQLLSEWREEMLKDVDENMDPSPILRFHCMEHILLKFHTYAWKDLQLHEKTLVNKHGQLG